MTGRTITTVVVLGALLACGLVASGCDSASSSQDSDAAAVPPSGRAATSLNVTLDRLLSEHAFLIFVAATETATKNPMAPAVMRAVAANARDITATYADVAGEEGAPELQRSLTRYNDAIHRYATLRTTGSSSAIRRAARTIRQRQQPLIAMVTVGTKSQQVVFASSAQTYTTSIIRSIDLYANGNYVAAYTQQHAASNRMSSIASELSQALHREHPERFSAPASALWPHLVGEHSLLIALVSQRMLHHAPDGSAAVAALETNTDALGSYVGLRTGPSTERAFLAQWRAHSGFVFDYADALARNDSVQRDKGRADLRGFTGPFARLLSELSGGNRTVIREALSAHGSDMLGALDASAAGDEDEAWSQTRAAYLDAYDVGAAMTASHNQQNFGASVGSGTEVASVGT